MKTALSIAGSDCIGGAGIQADLKTFSAIGVYGMSVITSVVAENTVKVVSYQDIEINIIKQQIDAVFEDIVPNAIKIGMLSNPNIINTVSEKLQQYSPRNIVIDPVMYAKNGAALMQQGAINNLISLIVPLADIITPNIPEAQEMTNIIIDTKQGMRDAAYTIHKMGCKAVVVKGGHYQSSGDTSTDILYDGHKFYEYDLPRIKTNHTHGTGCTFSSAIAAFLAKDIPINIAVEKAKLYVNKAIQNSPNLGRGYGPINHFYEL